MLSRSLFVISLLLALAQTLDSSAVSFINKCKKSDSKCLKESTQAAIPVFALGLPQLGVDSSDPIRIDRVDASDAGIKLILTDLVGVGLKGCLAKKIKFEDDATILVKVLCDIDINANYLLDGQVLILRMVGKGNIHIVLRKLQITVHAHLEEVAGEDGAAHWNITKWKHEYELKDKSTLELDNLFGGKNADLAQAASTVLSEGSDEIILTIGKPIVHKIVSQIVTNIENLFKAVDIKDLYNPE